MKNQETKKAAETKNVETAKQNTASVINTIIEKQQHYIYKVQSSAEKLSAKAAKQYRQKMRRKVENFYFAICLQKNQETKAAAIKEFLTFYKSHYILNDFSLKSLTDCRDAAKQESYKMLLQTVQNSLTK
jgi:type IV secretory pathway VirB4 component